MSPAIGEQLAIPSGLPRNIEAAILRYGNASYKAPVATVLDPNGKLSTTLTYGKEVWKPPINRLIFALSRSF